MDVKKGQLYFFKNPLESFIYRMDSNPFPTGLIRVTIVSATVKKNVGLVTHWHIDLIRRDALLLEGGLSSLERLMYGL